MHHNADAERDGSDEYCQNRYNAVCCDSLQHLLIQIVHFRQSDSGGVVQTAYDRGVVTRRQIRDDC